MKRKSTIQNNLNEISDLNIGEEAYMNNGERTKNKLSIYLIKEGIIEPEKIIKIEKANGGTVTITDSITVYIRKNTGYTPKWVNDFFVGFLDETQLMGSTVGCAALVRV